MSGTLAFIFNKSSKDFG